MVAVVTRSQCTLSVKIASSQAKSKNVSPKHETGMAYRHEDMRLASVGECCGQGGVAKTFDNPPCYHNPYDIHMSRCALSYIFNKE